MDQHIYLFCTFLIVTCYSSTVYCHSFFNLNGITYMDEKYEALLSEGYIYPGKITDEGVQGVDGWRILSRQEQASLKHEILKYEALVMLRDILKQEALELEERIQQYEEKQHIYNLVDSNSANNYYYDNYRNNYGSNVLYKMGDLNNNISNRMQNLDNVIAGSKQKLGNNIAICPNCQLPKL